MPRALPLLLVSAVAVVAAPGPKDRDKEPLYHPIREGAKRVYEYRAGNAAAEFAELVTMVEAKGGGFRVTAEREVDGVVKATIVTDVSAKGVFDVADAGADPPEPVPLLKLPARPGDTWRATRRSPPVADAMTTTYTVGKEEEVAVPAGTFKAIPVEATMVKGGRAVTSKSWYAPSVGLIKTSSSAGGRERVTVLKSFTPGK